MDEKNTKIENNENKKQFVIPEEVGMKPVSITKEMQTSYINYAMSVIISRALPDVRDGLKPVHRRILYAMWDVGLKSNAKFRKSAHVVGEVMAKYHPHGDAAIYDTLVRLAQDFSMRYPLVNGQGNFGSIDGDTAAAMRYTEVKLQKIAEELLEDIDKNTVDFMPTYDNSHLEPVVLPAKLPNLLLNGSMGIAVGMATNIPTHNLNEVCDAIIYLLDNPDAEVADLMQYIKGPDFPTGGIIYNIQDIRKIYESGKGGIIVRGKAEIEEVKNGFRILIAEIPYTVNKATLVEKIAECARERKIEGIKGIRDESDRDGMRIVVELKKDAFPEKVLNSLYKHTDLQITYHANMLALVDGIEPKVLNLKMFLTEFIKHRKQVVFRRTQFELDEAKKREHILQGLKIAIDNIDAVIETIKKSKDTDTAKVNLMTKFKLTEIQANAILEMQLRRLAALERQKIEDELASILKLISKLEGILADEKKIEKIIKDELQEMQQNYGDDRKTKIVKSKIGEFSAEDLIPNEPTVILKTVDGYIKRMSPDNFKSQHRGGKGVSGVTTKEEDTVENIFTTNTHADLMFFTTSGKVFQIKAYEIPETQRTSKGQALVNFLQISSNEKVSTILALEKPVADKYIIMVTEQGTIKKVRIDEFENVRKSGLIAIKLRDGDKLKWAKLSSGKDEIILTTNNGQSVRFNESNIRVMGRNASGVRGIKLKNDDIVVGMDIIKQDKEKYKLLVVSSNGYSKSTDIEEYRIQGRGGSGIKTMNITEKTGKLVSSNLISSKFLEKDTENSKDLIIMSEKGQVIRIALNSIPVLSRTTQGVRIMSFKEEGDKIASVTMV
ncbi:MAG TPA: DNA gyrase subunit A [bacterium]|nr:DNA gyrase subunit A [bacterium]